MNGKDAERILCILTQIREYLLNDQDRQAFYKLGRISEELAMIIKVDQVSFNRTVHKDED